MALDRWPTLSVNIAPEAGDIDIRGGGKHYQDNIAPGEFFQVSIGEYRITFASVRKQDKKIIKFPRKAER